MKIRGPRRSQPETTKPDRNEEPDKWTRAGWNAWIGAPLLERAWEGQRYVWRWEREKGRNLTSATVPLLLKRALWAEEGSECPNVFEVLSSALREAWRRAQYGDPTHLHAIAVALLNGKLSRGRQGLRPAEPWEIDRDEELVSTFERTKREIGELDALLPKQAKTPTELFNSLPSDEGLEQLVPTMEEDGPGRFVVRDSWLERVARGGREAVRPLLEGVSGCRRSGGINRHDAALLVWARSNEVPASSARAELAQARDRIRKRAEMRKKRKKTT